MPLAPRHDRCPASTPPPGFGRLSGLVIWIGILLLCGAFPAGADVSTEPVDTEIPGEVLVWFDESVSHDEALLELRSLGAREIEARFTPGLYRVIPESSRPAPGEIASASLAARTRAFVDEVAVAPGVRGAEPNQRGSGGFVPDDPLVDRQWYLTDPHGIEASPAWALTRGSAKVTVAILDSGLLFDHPEFEGRVAVNEAEYPPDGVDDDGNGLVDDYRGWDFVDDDNDPTDEHGHGTWTASVLAANADNDFGAAGIDHASRLLILRVLGADNRGSTADLIDALTYVTEREDVDLVNLSLVRFPASALLGRALERAARRSVLVACAGNDGPDTADSMYPGGHPATISVGSTDASDLRVPFSSTGASVSLVAPGWEIEVVDTQFPYHREASRSVSGCSFATPIVTGLAALLHGYGGGMDRVDTEAYLAASARDLGEPGWDPEYGWGRVNAQRALELLVIDSPRSVFLPGQRVEDPGAETPRSPGGVREPLAVPRESRQKLER